MDPPEGAHEGRPAAPRTAVTRGLAIPEDIDYAVVRGLSKEVQQKLSQQRPPTVGFASRIQGGTPAAISLLLVYLKRRDLASRAAGEEKRA